MIEANLIEQLVKKDRIIDLQKQEIKLWEDLVASYKRDEVNYKHIIQIQDDLIVQVQKLSLLKDAALFHLRDVINYVPFLPRIF